MQNRLKELRQELNMTQRELADKVGITPKAISFYELGQRQIPNEMLFKLSQIFNATPGYILGFSETRNYTLPQDEIAELVELFKKLSPEDQAMIISLADHMAKK